MDENTTETETNVRLKVSVADVVTATVVVVSTIAVMNLAADLVARPLMKLTNKLKKKTEELNTK